MPTRRSLGSLDTVLSSSEGFFRRFASSGAGIGSGGFHFIPPTLLEKEENKSHPLLKRVGKSKGYWLHPRVFICHCGPDLSVDKTLRGEATS
jgi:hypothetical protein